MFTRRSAISVVVLLALTATVYVTPADFPGGDGLEGIDYFDLHIKRIAFAREALFGPGHFLPGWYPRELFGTPFSANLQSFPWIPTRLLLLLVPDERLHYALAVLMAAALAAVFTYLFCRRQGLSEVASMAAGWTFAVAGFFSSRVFAGHLPVIEAYPSLPILLWLADRARGRRRDLVALAIGAACFAVAGHPQIPAYSLGAAALFLAFRRDRRGRLRALAALALGVGATLAAWWPMLLLAARSSRVLALDPAENDIALPYGRLLALLHPGVDGWPQSLGAAGKAAFSGYPSDAWFWDTASYIGLLPIVMALWLLLRAAAAKRLPGWPWGFLAALGAAALFFALPPGDFLRRMVPITLFRSPARLLYVWTFAMSIGLGLGVDAWLRSPIVPLAARRSAVAFCLLFQLFELGGFSRSFIRTRPWSEFTGPPPFAATLLHEVKDQRVGADNTFGVWCERRFDNIGGFDSIILSGPYRAILRMIDESPTANEESFDASDFPAPALRAAGVGFVVTDEPRDDLQLVAGAGDRLLYRVPDPAPRAAFAPGPAGGTVAYSRPSSDLIRLDTAARERGVVRVIESWDPGWTAEVDGAPVAAMELDGFAMGISVDAGKHVVNLRYRTPGRAAGWAMSLVCIGLLGVVIIFQP
jgi:hypothetical protein